MTIHVVGMSGRAGPTNAADNSGPSGSEVGPNRVPTESQMGPDSAESVSDTTPIRVHQSQPGDLARTTKNWVRAMALVPVWCAPGEIPGRFQGPSPFPVR